MSLYSWFSRISKLLRQFCLVSCCKADLWHHFMTYDIILKLMTSFYVLLYHFILWHQFMTYDIISWLMTPFYDLKCAMCVCVYVRLCMCVCVFWDHFMIWHAQRVYVCKCVCVRVFWDDFMMWHAQYRPRLNVLLTRPLVIAYSEVCVCVCVLCVCVAVCCSVLQCVAVCCSVSPVSHCI